MIEVAETVEPPVDEAAAAGPTGEPAGAGHLFGHFDGVDATEPAVSATVAPSVDEAAEAQAARERVAARARASVIRPQAVEEKDTDPRPQTNFFDQFDSDPDAGEVSLEERMLLNAKDSFYRGTIAGSQHLRTLAELGREMGWPDDIKNEYERIVSGLARYDMMRPWQTPAEAAASFSGQAMGGVVTPESILGPSIRGLTWLGRMGWTAFSQATVNTATDPLVQSNSIEAGVQKEYDLDRTMLAFPMGAVVGGGMAGLSEAARAGTKALRGNLAPDDPALRVPSDEPAARAPAGDAAPGAPADDVAPLLRAAGAATPAAPSPPLPNGAAKIGDGHHGPIIDGLQDRWTDAVAWLRTAQTGEALGVLKHPQVADRIDVIWGDAEHGLAHIIAQGHLDVLADLPQRLARMQVIQHIDPGGPWERLILRSATGEGAVVRLNYSDKGKMWKKTWLLTAYTPPSGP